MNSIYDLHAKAFGRVSAYVVMHDNERVATIAFKFPADGAGRLYAYVHWLGVPMVRGFAGGYGYDKRSAACANAVKHIKAPQADDLTTWERDKEAREAFTAALAQDSGMTWESQLREAGFTVLHAV